MPATGGADVRTDAEDPAERAGLVVGPVLRHVGATWATIFVEADRPCTVSVRAATHVATASTVGIRGHHVALAVLEDLPPGEVLAYVVELDGRVVWPLPAEDPPLPASVIRTVPERPAPVRVLFGSCRTAAPHEPPWTTERTLDERGRGVDALWAHAWRMAGQPVEQWPDLLVLMGDQVYADDTSPRTRERIRHRRDDGSLGPDVVLDFEEYCWLYRESWTPRMERWLLSVVPSVMIFDDHDMIDDWNISESWVRETREQPWWREHVLGGLMSYWCYQHLGNLSPDEIRRDGMLARLAASPDPASELAHWAHDSESNTPLPGGYRFSVVRDIGRVRIVVIDSRNGRVLTAGRRSMVDDDEWQWVVEQCRGDVDHLVLVTSLPVFVPGGLHDLQAWDEAVCDGRFGARIARLGERIRRGIDLEDWPAFGRSFRAMETLLDELSSGRLGGRPCSVTVLGGDIHFTYTARVGFRDEVERVPVHQIVCSPLRNALSRPERAVMRFAISRTGRGIARLLRRSVGLRRTTTSWEVEDGPVFANCIGLLTFQERRATVTIERSTLDGDQPVLSVVVDHELGSGLPLPTRG